MIKIFRKCIIPTVSIIIESVFCFNWLILTVDGKKIYIFVLSPIFVFRDDKHRQFIMESELFDESVTFSYSDKFSSQHSPTPENNYWQHSKKGSYRSDNFYIDSRSDIKENNKILNPSTPNTFLSNNWIQLNSWC